METFGPQEIVPNRPFAAPENSGHDLRIMNRMLGDLRRHIPPVLESKPAERYHYRQIEEADGALHKIVLPDWPSIIRQEGSLAVGFFGQARKDVDHTPIMELEQDLIDNMGNYPGLLVYYNVFWPDTGWGNLVLFRDATAKENWPAGPSHRQAVELSPNHYHSIRLHTGALPGKIIGPEEIHLVRTKYLDFNQAEPWLGVRVYE